MKTITTIIVIGLIAWVGFVAFSRASSLYGLANWHYFDTFLTVTPAILGFATIGMYSILNKSNENYREESGIAVGLTCIIALVIASVVSILIFFFNSTAPVEPSYPDQHQWNLMVLSGLLGLCVLIFFYWRIAAAIKKEKKEIDQRRKLLPAGKSLVDFLTDSLIDDPEQTEKRLLFTFSDVTSQEVSQAAKNTFRHYLKLGEFEQAELLLNYHYVDPNHLLKVSKALRLHRLRGKLDLKPQIVKIILDGNETAYEKLPCNWQKIHTYLAPLENEIEQADILDTGKIYITDQRVFFVGKKGSETVYLSDIAYMDHKEDAIQFFRDEGLSEIFAFPTPHHAYYAELVIKELMGREA